jgi:hypothetical protein
MGTVKAAEGLAGGANLSAGQTGNGVSTNVLDRGRDREACLLKITTTVGATPTVTVNIEASADGVTWFNAPYAAVATPETVSVATLAPITTATTSLFILRPGHPWRFLRLNYSANTNVTITADVYDAAR